MNNKSITVYDIAREANVSPATVSRVLTNNARVSEEKKKRVKEVIEKYDFEPNWLARSLSKQETNTIGMIVPDIRNPYYSTLFVKCELEAAKYGYNMILSNTISKLPVEENHIKNLLERRVDAIIQVGGSVDEVKPPKEYITMLKRITKKVPFIIAGELEGADVDVYRITPEKDHGMIEVLEFLFGFGHSKIAIAGGRESVIPTFRKRRAMEEFLLKRGIDMNPDYVIDSDYSIEGGYQIARQILNRKELPTAIVAINDMTAIGMIKVFNEHGIKVPDDISVIGYDDTYFSEISSPRLTSMSYNLEEYAKVIMETIKELTGKREVERVQYIPTKLKIRESCKKL